MPPAASRQLFLTKPSKFQIEYSINAWMDPKNQVDPKQAQEQWETLHASYLKVGAKVEVFEPLDGWPDSVFTGDAIFLAGKQGIASRFRVTERVGEVEPTVKRFEEKGYQIHRLPEGPYFEGNGEAILWNGMILAGYGVRSDRKALDFLAKSMDVEVIPLRVQPPHFHVDTIVCPLRKDLLAYVPSGMDEESLDRIEKLGVNLIAIDQDEALELACNSMALGDDAIVSTHKAPKFHKELEKVGFKVIPLDLSEFAKSGGGAKCLTLEAYG